MYNKKNGFSHNAILCCALGVAMTAMQTMARPAAAQDGYSWVFGTSINGGTTPSGGHIAITKTTSGLSNNPFADGVGSESSDGDPVAQGFALATALVNSPVTGGTSISTSASADVFLAYVTLQADYENAQGQIGFPQQGVQFTLSQSWAGSCMAAAAYTVSQSGTVTPNGSASSGVPFPSPTMAPGPGDPNTNQPGLYSSSPNAQLGVLATDNLGGSETYNGFTRTDSGLSSRIRGVGGIIQNGSQVWGENTDGVTGMLSETETYTLEYFYSYGETGVSDGAPVTVGANAAASGGAAVGVGWSDITVSGSAI